MPSPKRQIALAAILIAIAASIIDGTSVNVALPTIAATFGVSPAEVIRIASVYQIAMAALLLPFASLGEKFGYRRMLVIGLVLFILSSVVCFFATSLPALIAARGAQGVSSACMLGVTTALVRFTQPQRYLGRVVGSMALVVALSTGIGPAVGSAILALTEWRWIFVVNIPLALLALALSRALPVFADRSRRFSLGSAILSALTLGLMILGIGDLVSNPAFGLSCMAVALATGFLVVRREREHPTPLLPVDLIRLPRFAFAIAGSTFLFAAQMCSFVALPFHLQRFFAHVEVGLLLTVWPIAVAIIAPVAGTLSDRMEGRTLCAIGAAMLAAGLVLLALSPMPGSVPLNVVALLMSGAGFGLFQTPNNRSMLLAVPMHRTGAAGGTQGTVRQFGQAFGAALAAISFALSSYQGATISLSIAALLAGISLLVSLRSGTSR